MLTEEQEKEIHQLMQQLGTTGMLGDSTMDCQELYKTAYTLYGLGRLDQAISVFSYLVSKAPYHTAHWHGLGASFQLRKEYDKALICWSIFAILDNTAPEPHFYAAQCYRVLNNTVDQKKALALASERIEQAPPALKLKIEASIAGGIS